MSLILLQKAYLADPILTAIFKCKDHPSILAMQSNYEKEKFRFSRLTLRRKKGNTEII